MTAIQKQVYNTYNGLQSLFNNTDACHFLVLCTIIHESTGHSVNVFRLITRCVLKGWITESFFVNDAVAILEYATGHRWNVRCVKTLPAVIQENEFTEEQWFNPRTGFEHFKRRFLDTLLYSVTVKEGYIKQYRIYTMGGVK